MLTLLEPLMATAPWAAAVLIALPVLGAAVLLIAIVIMFVTAMRRVPEGQRVEAIKAMAELARELRPGRRKV